MTPDPRLDFVRELEHRAETLRRQLAEVEELAREADRVRRRATEVASFLARLPEERERLRRALEAAELDERAVAAELARADAELGVAEEGRDRERLAAARRQALRARDLHRVTERRLQEASAAVNDLEREAAAAVEEASLLEERARELAASLRGRPRLPEDVALEPGAGLVGVDDWGGRVRAALFVARGGLISDLDALVRQAIEADVGIAGEPGSVTTVSSRQVEREL